MGIMGIVVIVLMFSVVVPSILKHQARMAEIRLNSGRPPGSDQSEVLQGTVAALEERIARLEDDSEFLKRLLEERAEPESLPPG